MELQEVRNTILVELSHPVDVVPLVNRMDFAQCTYLLSVLKMEKMRVVNRLFLLLFRGWKSTVPIFQINSKIFHKENSFFL